MYGKIVRKRGTFRNGFEIRFEHPNGKHMDWMFVPKTYMAGFIDDIMSEFMKIQMKEKKKCPTCNRVIKNKEVEAQDSDEQMMDDKADLAGLWQDGKEDDIKIEITE